MADTIEQRNDRAAGDIILMIGALLSVSLPHLVSIPQPEAIFAGWMIAFLVGYFISPRRSITFVRWMLERLILTTYFYLVVLKTPLMLKRSLPSLFAYGIPVALFMIGGIAWLRYSKNSSRTGRA